MQVFDMDAIHESSGTTDQVQFKDSPNSLWDILYNARGDPPFGQSGEATQLLGSSQSYAIESDQQEIPIVSPVPLPYTAQSTAVLRRMISTTQETNLYARTLKSDDLEGWTDDYPTSSYTPPSLTYPQDVEETSPLPSSPFQPPGTTSDALRPITIRPITPETLMALTEPCLMAWCLVIDSAPTEDLYQTLRLQTSSFPNSWGY